MGSGSDTSRFVPAGCIRRLNWTMLAALLLLAVSRAVAASAEDAPVRYDLAVSFSPDRAQVSGTANIRLPRSGKLSLFVEHLRVRSVSVDGRPWPNASLREAKRLNIPRGRRATVVFDAHFDDPVDHGILPGIVVLTDHWFPVVDNMVRYSMRASLPRGYAAVSEAEEVAVRERGGRVEYSFAFPHPLPGEEGLTLVASNRFSIREEMVGNVKVRSLLRDGMEGRSGLLLAQARRLLIDYAAKFGPYPYGRLDLVDAPVTSSMSLPTFLLLARENIRELPADPTLAHELVHQWFGNSVYIDWKSGNWSEGAAIYFADHAFMEEAGMGWSCRRRIMQGHRAWAAGKAEFPLTRFAAQEDRLSRGIGYGKGALVYHMLRRQVGDQAFSAGIRDFLRRNRNRIAAWQDLRASLERTSGSDLGWFFRQWVSGVGFPLLRAEAFFVAEKDSRFTVTVKVACSNPPFRLSIPISVRTDGEEVRGVADMNGSHAVLRLETAAVPREVVIDEDYDLLRSLTDEECAPGVGRLEAARSLSIAPSPKDQPPGEVAAAFPGGKPIGKQAGDEARGMAVAVSPE